MDKVSLIKCENYNQENVDLAVKQAIDNLGGIENFVKPNQTVILKANLVGKYNVEKAATTHPSVVGAVGKLCKTAGASRVIIADSAGGPFTEGYMNGIYKTTGMQAIAEEFGLELNQNYNSLDVTCPDAKVGKKFQICECLEQADVIINVTKLKTHCFTGFTNSVKNMFGAIPGLAKVEMHGQYRTLDVFGDFLYDILDYFKGKLVLHVTDAVVGMEGAGPTSGTPRQIGAIVAGSNPVSVDAVCARLMNLDPLSLPNIAKGVDRGYISSNLDDIQVLGEKVDDLVVKDYKTVIPDGFKPLVNYVPKCMQNTVHKLMTRRPVIKRKECKGCKKCHDHCPVGAITMEQKKGETVAKARIDYSKCIRCFCCQELCPFGVVKVKSGLGYKIIHLKKNKKPKN